MPPESLKAVLDRIRGDRGIYALSEQAIRQGLVLPILSKLDWDRDNIREVVPEFAVGNGRVDYCLKVGDRKHVFVETKRHGDDLQNHQEQLLQYAFRDGVNMAVLTNGLSWWLYLPLLQGSWDDRKFLAIDIERQSTDIAAGHFIKFLSRASIADGSAIAAAREIHASAERSRVIAQTIPQAWQQLCREPPEALLDVFADRVESICGHKPDPDQLAQFLARPSHIPPRPTAPPDDPRPIEEQPQPEAYTFGRLAAFLFRGQRMEVSTWKEILVGVANILHQAHGADFVNRVMQLQGRRRPYFSESDRGMRAPSKVPGSSVWMETHGSANTLMERCHTMLGLFGYTPDALTVEQRH